MDNRVFNINGRGLEALKAVILLALEQNDGFYDSRHNKKELTIEAFRVSPDKGLILYSYAPEHSTKDVQKLLAPMTAEQIAPMVLAWVEKQFAEETKFPGGTGQWDHDCDHDGSNSHGWRAYVEDWGHVEDDWGVVCAIVPAFMWHGK